MRQLRPLNALITLFRKLFLKGALSWVVAIVFPPVIGVVLWNVFGSDAVTRLGYLFWLHDWSVNETSDMGWKLSLFQGFFNYIIPLSLAVVGLGWKIIFSIKPKAVNPPNG